MDEIRYEVRYSAKFDPIAMRITEENIALAPPIAVQVEDGTATTLRAGSVIEAPESLAEEIEAIRARYR